MSRTDDDQRPSRSVGEHRFRVVFYLALLVYLVVHLIVLRGYRWDDKLFPYLVGIPLVVLLAVQLVMVADLDVVRRIVDELPGVRSVAGGTDPPRGVALRSELTILAWTIALPIFIYFVGFVYALPTYIFVFILWFTRNPRQAIVTTLLFVVFGYLLFVEFLSIRIYDGVLGLPDLLDLL